MLSPEAQREAMRGDGPCADCGTLDNIVWFTESVFWNAVCRSDPDYVEPILCIPCFAARAEAKGYRPTGWRLIPEWHWTNVGDEPGRNIRDWNSGTPANFEEQAHSPSWWNR